MSDQAIINIKVHYFAKIKEIMKKQNDVIYIDKKQIKGKEVFQLSINENRTLTNELIPIFQTCLIALNDQYIDREEEINLKNGDEISILPPISAG